MTKWQHLTLATMGLATATLVAGIAAGVAVLAWPPAFDTITGWLTAAGVSRAKEMPAFHLAIALPLAGAALAQATVWLQQRCMAVLVHFAMKRLQKQVGEVQAALGEDAALQFAEHKMAAMIDGIPAPVSFDVFGARDVFKKVTGWTADRRGNM